MTARRREIERSLPGVCQDCPERARDERLLREKDGVIHLLDVLDREANHRLLNGLQIVVSLLSLQSRATANAGTAADLADAANRVATIIHIHQLLRSMDGLHSVVFRPFLNELCADYSKMSRMAGTSQREMVVEAIDILVPAAVGMPLGMIANELLTNAMKHGKGRITITLEGQPATGFAMSVCNDGSTLPPGFDPAASKGLGMKLILSLVEQIGGELHIDRCNHGSGTCFSVMFANS